MTDRRPGEREADRLPEALEDEVLRALEQDDAHRRTVLQDLLAREPTYAPTIRRWLHDSGVSVPPAPTTAGEGAAAERDDKERIDGYRLVRLREGLDWCRAENCARFRLAACPVTTPTASISRP